MFITKFTTKLTTKKNYKNSDQKKNQINRNSLENNEFFLGFNFNKNRLVKLIFIDIPI